jgi:hypothetical protein
MSTKRALASKKLKASEIWSEEKMNTLRTYILVKSKEQSPERKLMNELLSIRFQMEDLLEEIKLHDNQLPIA